MKPAALLDLPVQPGGMRVVDLHSINAEVVFFSLGMFGVDERQSDEWTAIFLPRGQDRQLIKTRRSIDNLCDRRSRSVPRSELQQLERDRAMIPELGRFGWQDRLGNLNHVAH